LEIRRRLAAGHLAFVARYRGNIVHAGWVAFERAWIGYLSCEITLAADEAYQYESFTAPGFRGLNIAALRVTGMMRYCREAAFRRLIAVVMPENSPAFRPLEKAGYRPFGVMGYVKIGRWRWNFCSASRHSGLPGAFIVHPRSRLHWEEMIADRHRGALLSGDPTGRL
jgi:RimJ/RimL family protein N-acetyltransferase